MWSGQTVSSVVSTADFCSIVVILREIGTISNSCYNWHLILVQVIQFISAYWVLYTGTKTIFPVNLISGAKNVHLFFSFKLVGKFSIDKKATLFIKQIDSSFLSYKADGEPGCQVRGRTFHHQPFKRQSEVNFCLRWTAVGLIALMRF